MESVPRWKCRQPTRRSGSNLDENGEFVGGISKFLQERKETVIAALGLKPGDFIGLTAGKKLAAQKTAGVLRRLLGSCEREAHEEGLLRILLDRGFPDV